MSAKVWRFSCCQKRKDRGQHASKTKQKGKDIDGVSMQPSTGRVDTTHGNNFRESGGQYEPPDRTTKAFLSSTPVENKQKTGIEDQGGQEHDQNRSTGVTLNGFEQKDFVCKVGTSAITPSERERDYQLMKKRLETAQREKHELEAQVLQANQNVRDLRHEIAVLLKRLQVAENRLPNPTPLCPPPPPPLPPPAPPHVNPLRALLTIIQKRRNSRDPNICPLQDAGPLPDCSEDTEVSYNHQCPGMNEVLEMIRGGVSLRHVIQVHKETFRAGEEGSEPVSSRLVPELQKILRKRKVSTDKHVSDGSCDASMEEDPAAHGPSPPREDPTSGSSPGEVSPGESSRQNLPNPEDFPQDHRGADCEVDERQSDGDAASTASTLPLTSPLDQGPLGSANASPHADGPSVDSTKGHPPMDGHTDPSAGSVDPRPSLVERGPPTDCSSTVDPANQPNHCPTGTDRSQVLRYLNWERWNGVDIKTALPLRSIFKSVSFMTGGGEKVALGTTQGHRSSSLEALESDHSCQSFGSSEFDEGAPDVPEDAGGRFSLLHDMLRPPTASSEEGARASMADEVARVLSPEFLEESVDGPELDSPLPGTQPSLSPASFPPERGCF